MTSDLIPPPAPDHIPRLAERLAGTCSTVGQEAFDTDRRAWNLAVDQHPTVAVRARTVSDVRETLGYARSHGLRVAPQGTGHHAAALGDLAGTVLLRMSDFRDVQVDPDSRTVRVGAGATWGDVTAACAPHDLVGLMGSSSGVGVAGYLLGGGCSWFGRQYGLACNSVTAAELVTGAGDILRVDAETEPELFWAIRGGGGNAAVVTAWEFTVYPAGDLYGGMLLYPIERAAEIFDAYRSWSPGLDTTAATCLRLLRLPPLPQLPEPLRGRHYAGIDGVFAMTEPAATALLAPLRALGPAVDTFAPITPAEMDRIHLDPPDPVPGVGDGMVMTSLTADATDTILRHAGAGTDCPLLAVDIRQLGGAFATPAPGGGAMSHLAGDYALYGVGVTPTPSAADAVRSSISSLTTALRPWSAPLDYPNFRETKDSPTAFHPDEVLQRLLAVQRHYDPDHVVRAGHEWNDEAPARPVIA